MEDKKITVRAYNDYTGEVIEFTTTSATKSKRLAYNAMLYSIKADNENARYYVTFLKRYRRREIHFTKGEYYKSYLAREEEKARKENDYYEYLNGADGIRAQREAIIYTI